MNYLSLLIVLFVALSTPLMLAKFKITNIPTAVAEIMVGILLGKSLFNIVQVNPTLDQLSSLGVIFLLFLSGMEIDFNLFKPTSSKQSNTPTPVKTASLSFLAILIAAFVVSGLLAITGLFHDILLATIIFSTIALGIVIATLKEKELLSQPLGQTLLLIAALGEVGPLLMLTIYASLHGSNAQKIWLISLIFLAAIVLLMRSRKIYQFFDSIDKATTQLDIRLAFFLIIALVAVAEEVGAENILGAFLAGIVMKLLRPKEETQDKLTSMGYGFFIPIFFIMTGAKLDLKTLFANPKALILIPILLACFILAKLPVVLFLRRAFKPTNAWAGTFLTSTTITLVLPALTVGENLKLISTTQVSAFTLAAVIICLLGPIMFNQLYVPEPESHPKQRVHFIGANLITVPIAQQLAKGWYNVRLYTDRPDNFRTYNSEANVTYLKTLSDDRLTENHAFDADIIVMAYADANKDYELAQLALKHKVPRIIARFENKNIANAQYDILAQQGVEVFNTFETNIALLRSLIEAPATFQILNDTESGLFEAVVHNRRFAGMKVKNLPFIDTITIARIWRDGQFFAPHGDTEVQQGDHLIFTGNKTEISQIHAELEKQN